jgi:hypothetical protein
MARCRGCLELVIAALLERDPRACDEAPDRARDQDLAEAGER